jgi:hypothetical protein
MRIIAVHQRHITLTTVRNLHTQDDNYCCDPFPARRTSAVHTRRVTFSKTKLKRVIIITFFTAAISQRTLYYDVIVD